MFLRTWKFTAVMLPSLFFWLSGTSVQAEASTCPAPVPASYPAPVVRNGFEARLVATGLKKPRGVIVDSKGRLLVVEAGKGITHLTIKDDGWPCLSVEKTTTIVSMIDLNHGIQLSIDGKTLYASSSNSVYSWAYDADAIRVSDEKSPKTLISNMTNAGGGHSTRTLLISRKQPEILLVSRGSGSNIDNGATDHSSGISQIRAFNISDPNLGTPGGDGKVYDYPSEGWTIGWGLRNSVGVAEEPSTGGIYSVENSADGIKRFGVDIHEDSPGEEMNYHGVLRFPANRSSSSTNQAQQQGGNHGYPYCLALYNSSATPSFPSLGNLKTGSQFTHDSTPYSIPFLPSSDSSSSSSQAKPINITTSDISCSSTNFIPPRLTFPAHTAPLDIKFSNGNGNSNDNQSLGLGLAYISFHGSWDRSTPAGYKLSAVRFDTSKGEPIEASDSTNSLVDIMWNRDVSKCPGQCFRPVGLAVDEQERIWMTDDDKGDVWVLKQVGEVKDEEGAGADGGSGSGNVNGDSDSAAAPMRVKRSGSYAEWLGGGMSAMAAVVGSLVFAVL